MAFENAKNIDKKVEQPATDTGANEHAVDSLVKGLVNDSSKLPDSPTKQERIAKNAEKTGELLNKYASAEFLENQKELAARLQNIA